MLKIGEFSKLSRVSIRMLRHYDDIGLLKPAFIDRFTSYRYYEEEQLTVIGRITALRDMGFSLADVIKILEIYDDRLLLDSYLKRRQTELEELAHETAHRQRLLDTARKRLRKDKPMNYDISVKTIPERYAATVRTTLPHYDDEGKAWQILCTETDPMNMTPDEPCLCAVTYLDDEAKEEDIDVLVWKTVRGHYPDTEHVKFCSLPAVKVASCVIKGSYAQMNDCYAAVIAWIHENGHEITGPCFNIYHVSPYESANEDDFVTEVCFPIA